MNSKPVPTPIVKTTNLHQNDSNAYQDPVAYRRLVGRLLYLTNTRPYINYVAPQLSQLMANPTTAYFKTMTRVLRYIKGSPGQRLFYGTSSYLQLKAFSDYDWASCIDSRKSITCLYVFLGNSLVSWKSKKQNTLARSSLEAEYKALAATSCEIQWLTYMLDNFRIPFKRPAPLYCDNDPARPIAANSVFHERTKHIDIDCHVVKEHIQSNMFHLLPIKTTQQCADILTKALDPSPFIFLLSKLGVINIYSPACGGGGYWSQVIMLIINSHRILDQTRLR
ncbi:PREDICTED: uncharacterized protein LOC109359830 [Lupinus angustifolius]|uniref:uncharacterized protein LOC109359830 n=1 Tax=Lupinus angustifolius TaxID=3871 RepID=UPI00092F8308|nr:PREDICTED: uncharacterized protein LOC109359830 [Lupinus angustifolius]